MEREMTKNEDLLKRTAVTFASEAIASDVKQLLSEKISYSLQIFHELNNMVQSVSQSKNRRIGMLLSKNSPLIRAFELASDDLQTVFGAYDLLLQKLFKDLEILDSDEVDCQKEVDENPQE